MGHPLFFGMGFIQQTKPTSSFFDQLKYETDVISQPLPEKRGAPKVLQTWGYPVHLKRISQTHKSSSLELINPRQEKERELEELRRTNPELALEEMEKLERTRIAERATLKHRNSSKYLQMQSRRVEYFWLLSTLYS